MRAAGRARRTIPPLLVALALLALPLLELVLRGRGALDVVEVNLPTPAASSGLRIIDLVHATAPAGRVQGVIVEQRDDPAARPPPGARIQLQMSSLGRTRLLIVQREADTASRLGALGALLAGDATLQLVDDRQWVDLGSLPADGAPLRVQVVGLLPGPFAFAELDRAPETMPRARFEVTLVPSGTPVVATAPRWRIVRDAPLTAREVLARVTFFVRTSPLLLLAALGASGALCAGWVLLGGRRAWSAIALLVAAPTLLHATLLPPLQGADETSQAGTIEALVADPSPAGPRPYPASFSRVAGILEQDRVQYHPLEPLPLGDAAARARVASVLESTLREAGATAGPAPPAAELQAIELRAPLFFAPYPWLRAAWLRGSILDRMAGYRLLATSWGLAGFVLGLGVLCWTGQPLAVGVVYGALFLVPYVVGVTATCSNYAPAIGSGFLIAAAAVSAIASPRGARRRIAAAIALATAWAAVPLWPDFLALAILLTVAALLAGARAGARVLRARGRSSARIPLWTATLTVAAVLLAGWTAWRHFPQFNADLPRVAGRWDARELALRAALVVAPWLLAALVGALVWAARATPTDVLRRRSRIASAALLALLLALFAVTPYAEVPYERTFLPLDALLRAHLSTFLASSFSFDQDRLGWKFFFGAFGWHDVFYPEAIYATAKIAFVLLLAALPVLMRDFARARPGTTVALLLLAAAGASLSVVTLLARHAMSVHPHGRFVLPYLPLVALPVLVPVATGARVAVPRALLRLAVALDVWTAIALLGARYYLQR